MYLHTLSLINFKNIEQENLSLSPDINCLVGDNGAGKTNVIDAVYRGKNGNPIQKKEC